MFYLKNNNKCSVENRSRCSEMPFAHSFTTGDKWESECVNPYDIHLALNHVFIFYVLINSNIAYQGYAVVNT